MVPNHPLLMTACRRRKVRRPTPRRFLHRRHRRSLMSCSTPERSAARPDPSSPKTPGSSGARSRSKILSGGLWRSAGSLVLDEAASGEWCARSEDSNRCAVPRCVCAVHVGSPCVRARVRVRACGACALVHAGHWHTRASASPAAIARGSGALWKYTGPNHGPLGTAGVFERLFFRLNEEQEVLVYYSDDQRLSLTASRNRPLGTIPLSGGAVSVYDAHPDHAFCFVLDVPSPPAKRSSYLLAGDSQAERVQWMAALSRHGVLPLEPHERAELGLDRPSAEAADGAARRGSRSGADLLRSLGKRASSLVGATSMLEEEARKHSELYLG